jgi:hypothetical protein
MNEPMVKIDVPQSALVAAFLEKMTRAEGGFFRVAAGLEIPILERPEIGAPFHGGIYAGITLDGATPMALVLLPGDDEMPWKQACEWAIKMGGELPTRMDALVLWQNVPKEFKEAYYWTREENASNADYAWSQYFGLGRQGNDRKSDELRCRAVRRVAI